jgi:hypothetical protein
LAPVVREAVTSQSGKVHRALKAARCPRLPDHVASLVGDGTDMEAFPAILQHLGHERQLVRAATLVQCSQDFLRAAHLNDITGAKAR